MKKWYSDCAKYFDVCWKNIPEHDIVSLASRIRQLNDSYYKPVASLVFIAHNEESHLYSALRSVVNTATSLPIEVIVINNNSTDSTEELLQVLGVTYYNEQRKGPGHARNCGLDHARGQYYLCLDSDAMYPPHYIDTMVKALKRPGTSCAYGFWSFLTDEHHSAIVLWCYELLRDIYLRLQQIKRPELNVRGMVFAFPTELGRKYRFRTDIIRGEDGSLALYMKADGKLRLVTSRKARPITGHGTIDQDGSIAQMLKVRFKKAINGGGGLFKSKATYEDIDSNLIK